MVKSSITDSPMTVRVKVIMACYNRSEITARFFHSFSAAKKDGWDFTFVVTNDGSTDDTQALLESQPYQIKIYEGSGALFWAKSILAKSGYIAIPLRFQRHLTASV